MRKTGKETGKENKSRSTESRLSLERHFSFLKIIMSKSLPDLSVLFRSKPIFRVLPRTMKKL